MFELILTTIKDNLIKIKREIISDIQFALSRDTAEIRYDLLEIKNLLKEQRKAMPVLNSYTGTTYYKNTKTKNH